MPVDVFPEEYVANDYINLLVKAAETDRRRLLLGIPVTGLVRIEWVLARYGQTIPCNWSVAEHLQPLNQVTPLGYDVKDARNIIVQTAVQQNFEWCFRPETLVETEQGACRICDVHIGDFVKTHLGRYRRVLGVSKRRYPQRQPLIWIRTRHSTIKCTPEHPFYCVRDGQRSFVPACDLQLTDELLYPSPATSKDTLAFDIRYNSLGPHGDARKGSRKYAAELGTVEVTEDIARFLGLYLAEGCGGTCGITFTFHNDERSYIDHIVRVSQEIFGRTPNIRMRWATNVTINIRPLQKRFREWFGANAREKRVPFFVFDWALQNRLAFLKGYLDGDGCHTHGYGNTFVSASKQMIEDVLRLASSCGLESSAIWQTKPATSVYQDRLFHGHGAYTARIKAKSWGKLRDLLDARYEDHMLHIPIQALEEHRVSASLVDDYVYNLQVEEDDSYIADSVAVHNCFFLDHDVILPADTFLKLNEYMRKGDIPIVSGLYCTKSHPSEPLVYRGRGNSYFRDWAIGDKVWCDGTGMGCNLISVPLLKLMWQDAPEYLAGGNQKVRKVFDTPQFVWVDPEQGSLRGFQGTEDLAWYDRVFAGDYLAKAGFKKIAKKKWPILVDSSIFCRHIDQNGTQYPLELRW